MLYYQLPYINVHARRAFSSVLISESRNSALYSGFKDILYLKRYEQYILMLTHSANNLQLAKIPRIHSKPNLSSDLRYFHEGKDTGAGILGCGVMSCL